MAGVRSDEVSSGLDEGARDTLAMDVFVAVHRDRLLRLAGLVCGDVASAEDIVQMALERAWRSRRTLGSDERLRPWLDRIVVREAARERRSRLTWLGRLVRPPTVREIEASGGDLVDHVESPDPVVRFGRQPTSPTATVTPVAATSRRGVL